MLEILQGLPLFRRLSVQLALLMTALVIFSIGLFGLFSYHLAYNTLEDELGRRLVTVASLGADELKAEELYMMVPKGRAYGGVQKRLAMLAKRAGLERLVLFDASQKVMVDSQGRLKWGDVYYPLKLDLVEWRWAMRGKAVDTPLFGGGPGSRMFKSALVPVKTKDGSVVAILRAEADAAFLAVVRTLAWSMLALGVLSLALALGFAVWATRRVVRPINELIEASRRVAGGDFTVKILEVGRGELGEAVRTFNEMTRQLEVFVKEKERLATLGELSAGVAHEIRNPLAAIAGFAGLLEKNLGVKDKRRGYAKDILDEVRILNRFITDFLDYSRPSPPRLEVFDLRELAESAGRVSIPGRSRKWKIKFTGPATRAVADPDQLRQVVINLVKNAKDAMPDGGSIRVKVGKKGSMALLEVEDSGKGMDKETREKLFTPFFTTKPMGTGLGLSIVAKLLEGLGGEIKIRSEVGKGSRFVILIPHEMNTNL